MGTTYQTGNSNFLDGTTDWAAATDHQMALCEAGYSPDPDDDDMADISNELSGGNYSRTAIDNQSVVIDDANNQIELDCDDVTFSALEAAAGTPTQAVSFLEVGADADDILHVTNDLTTPPLPNGGDYVIQPSAEGLIKIAS